MSEENKQRSAFHKFIPRSRSGTNQAIENPEASQEPESNLPRASTLPLVPTPHRHPSLSPRPDSSGLVVPNQFRSSNFGPLSNPSIVPTPQISLNPLISHNRVSAPPLNLPNPPTQSPLIPFYTYNNRGISSYALLIRQARVLRASSSNLDLNQPFIPVLPRSSRKGMILPSLTQEQLAHLKNESYQIKLKALGFTNERDIKGLASFCPTLNKMLDAVLETFEELEQLGITTFDLYIIFKANNPQNFRALAKYVRMQNPFDPVPLQENQYFDLDRIIIVLYYQNGNSALTVLAHQRAKLLTFFTRDAIIEMGKGGVGANNLMTAALYIDELRELKIPSSQAADINCQKTGFLNLISLVNYLDLLKTKRELNPMNKDEAIAIASEYLGYKELRRLYHEKINEHKITNNSTIRNANRLYTSQEPRNQRLKRKRETGSEDSAGPHLTHSVSSTSTP